MLPCPAAVRNQMAQACLRPCAFAALSRPSPTARPPNGLRGGALSMTAAHQAFPAEGCSAARPERETSLPQRGPPRQRAVSNSREEPSTGRGTGANDASLRRAAPVRPTGVSWNADDADSSLILADAVLCTSISRLTRISMGFLWPPDLECLSSGRTKMVILNYGWPPCYTWRRWAPRPYLPPVLTIRSGPANGRQG